jgi:hypothetical protein
MRVGAVPTAAPARELAGVVGVEPLGQGDVEDVEEIADAFLQWFVSIRSAVLKILRCLSCSLVNSSGTRLTHRRRLKILWLMRC